MKLSTDSSSSTSDIHPLIESALQFVNASDRDTWLRMGMAIKSELGDSGVDLWDGWSQQADSYNAKDARDVWKSIRAGGGITIATLFHEAKANGWRDARPHSKPSPEAITEHQRNAAERAKKEAATIARERANAAAWAAEILKEATEAKADHPYLVRKQISPAATLREIDADAAAAILGYTPKSGGEPLTGRLLVVPVRQGKGISTLELIDGDGRKAALKGRGSKVGGYWATERLPDGDGNGLTLLIGEGVATVMSASAATEHTGIAALSASNLLAVATAMRERYPAAALVILADLVKATGKPDPHAIEAAQSVGGTLSVPEFGKSRNPGATDFNDMAALRGLEAVKAAIDGKDQTAPTPAKDYRAASDGTYWIKETKEGTQSVLLANFVAEIIAETVVDDGAERKRRLEITGKAAGQAFPVATILSGQFAGMNWVGDQWGSAAQIAPGMGLKDRLRYAIQVLSENVQHQTVYEHTGWRELDGQWRYLSQIGAIGADGLATDTNVQLGGSLENYALALPDDPATVINASLKLLQIAPAWIAAPLFLAPYRALIGEALPVDFSLFAAGITGSRKTEMAALVQAHFGDAWHGKHLPGSWSSTANSLERSAFLAKDAVFVVDDFCPTGTTTDVARLHKDADRLLRAQGNRAGRLRMNADGSLRPAYYPRGLIVATGEDIPRGQSLRGRLLILEFSPDTVNLDALTSLQQAAGTGQLAAAAGAFCQWLAPRITQLKKELPARRNQLRNEINATAHSRHPDTLAGLMLTAELFHEFATTHGVQLPLDWIALITDALLQAGKEQQQAIASEEPAARFVRLIESALAAGRCHLKPMDGKPLTVFGDFTGYGWQLKTYGGGENARTDWHECGPCIGRFKEGEPFGVYLDTEAAYGLAQKMADEQGHAIPLQQRSLFKALFEKGLLLSRNEPHYTIKVKLPDKTTKRFLHVRVGGQNYGNCGNCGNQAHQADDFEKKKAVPTHENAEKQVGTVGTSDQPVQPIPEAGCHSVPTIPTRFPLAKTEWEPENACNPLPDNEFSNPVPTVPIVPTFCDRPPARVADPAHSPIAQTVIATLSGTPKTRTELERLVGQAHGGAGTALIVNTIDRLLLSGAIAPAGGRLHAAKEARP